MGSAQSSPTAQPPMKITKPKTNRSSTNLLARSSTEPDLSIAAMAARKAAGSVSGDGGSVVGSESRRRRKSQLLSLANLSALDEANGQDGSPTSTKTGSRDRLSRTGSLVSHVSSNRGSTTRLSSLWDSRLSLVAESSPAETSFAGRTLEALDETTPAEEPTTTLPYRASTWDQATPDRPSILAGRRRSMFTPGVATRGRLSRVVLEESLDRRRLESKASEERLPDRPTIESARRSTLAALQLAHDDASAQRVATPTGLEYQQLGCFARGSLHVTNGAPSPVPSTNGAVLRPSGPDHTAFRDGYFPTVPARHLHHHEPARPTAATLDHVPLTVRNETGRAGLALGHVPARESRQRGGPAGQRESKSVPASQRTFDRSPPLDVFELSAEPVEKKLREPEPQAAPPATVAQQYLAEIPTSPFLGGDVPTSGWRVPAMLVSEPEQYGFDDEGVVTSPDRSYDQLERTDVAGRLSTAYTDRAASLKVQDAAVAWPQRRPSPELHFGQGPSSAGTGASSQESGQGDSQTSLTKADSGYSSHTSLRSLHGNPSSETGLEARPAVSRQPSSVYTRDTAGLSDQPDIPEESPPPPPPKGRISRWSRTPAQAPPVPPKPTSRRSQSNLASLVRGWTRSTQNLDRAPEPPAKDVDQRSKKTVETRKSTDLSSRSRSPGGRRKLQKQMPASVAREKWGVVHGEAAVHREDIPPVPSIVMSPRLETLNSSSNLAVDIIELEGSPVARSSTDGDSLLARVGSPIGQDSTLADAAASEKAVKKGRRGSLGEYVASKLRRMSSSLTNLPKAGENASDAAKLDTAVGSLGGDPDQVAKASSSSVDKAEPKDSVDSDGAGRLMTKTKSMVELANAAAVPGEGVDQSSASRRPRPRSYCSSESIEQIQQRRTLKKPRRPKSMIMMDAFDSSPPPPVPSVPAIHLQNGDSVAIPLFPPSSATGPSAVPSNSSASQKPIERKTETVQASPIEPRPSHQHQQQQQQQRRGGEKSKESTRPAKPEAPGKPSEKTKQVVGKKSSAAGRPLRHVRSFAQLQRTHGLDLRDVPISVQV